jgi:diguanylate cyclase (GGDEF)-like protein
VGNQTRRIGILAFVYLLVGKLSLMLAFLHPSASAVWPNSGLALAALLVFGIELWPGIFLGAFLVHFLTDGSMGTSLAIAAGNTLEAVVGAWLVRKFAGGANAILRAHDIFRFTILAGVLSTTLAATVGVTSLAVSGSVDKHEYWLVWLTWWLGDTTGVVIVAPVLLTLALKLGRPLSWSDVRPEALALLVTVFAVGQIVFNGILVPSGKNYPLEYLCIPLLAWSAFRFGQRETAISMLLLSVSAIWGTLSGFGPFGGESLNESLLLLQAFLGVAAALSMVLAAEVAERRRSENEALSLATTDPLTGLGNYRRFHDALDGEIRRSGRHKRQFALLLLDLDGLKKINDVHGHLTGNRALCRLADVIRLNCRSFDVTVRYGGDEFAILLPESDRQTAYRVAGRIRAGLAGDLNKPTLTVSVGVAVWPVDGSTFETLLDTADLDLYDMKNQSGGKHFRRSELA